MTPVDEARAALLALAPADGPFAQRLDALIAAVRAEFNAESYGHGLDFGRAESAETLRTLREAVETWLVYFDRQSHSVNISPDERTLVDRIRAALTRREPLDVERLITATRTTPGIRSLDEDYRRSFCERLAAEYARLEAADA